MGDMSAKRESTTVQGMRSQNCGHLREADGHEHNLHSRRLWHYREHRTFVEEHQVVTTPHRLEHPDELDGITSVLSCGTNKQHGEPVCAGCARMHTLQALAPETHITHIVTFESPYSATARNKLCYLTLLSKPCGVQFLEQPGTDFVSTR